MPRLTTAMMAALSLAVPSAAEAAKGGGSPAPSSSVTLNEPAPRLGSTVTFTTVAPKTVKDPRVAVRCYDAAGAMTYAEAGPDEHAFLLGGAGSDWLRAGGGADCTAELFHIVWSGSRSQQVHSLAWTSFQAAG